MEEISTAAEMVIATLILSYSIQQQQTHRERSTEPMFPLHPRITEIMEQMINDAVYSADGISRIGKIKRALDSFGIDTQFAPSRERTVRKVTNKIRWLQGVRELAEEYDRRGMIPEAQVRYSIVRDQICSLFDEIACAFKLPRVRAKA